MTNDNIYEGYDKLRALAESPSHIIPGHDPLVMAHYPAPSKALEGIAVRLDVPPSRTGRHRQPVGSSGV